MSSCSSALLCFQTQQKHDFIAELHIIRLNVNKQFQKKKLRSKKNGEKASGFGYNKQLCD